MTACASMPFICNNRYPLRLHLSWVLTPGARGPSAWGYLLSPHSEGSHIFYVLWWQLYNRIMSVSVLKLLLRHISNAPSIWRRFSTDWTEHTVERFSMQPSYFSPLHSAYKEYTDKDLRRQIACVTLKALHEVARSNEGLDHAQSEATTKHRIQVRWCLMDSMPCKHAGCDSALLLPSRLPVLPSRLPVLTHDVIRLPVL